MISCILCIDSLMFITNCVSQVGDKMVYFAYRVFCFFVETAILNSGQIIVTCQIVTILI